MVEEVVNFGGNVRFSPSEQVFPKTEKAVLDLLKRCAASGTKLRVTGSRHSWNGVLLTDQLLVDMRHFNKMELSHIEGDPVVKVGAGCTLKRLLKRLNRKGLTLPTLGAITKQTIGGVICTATHGSGKQSLSHFVRELKVATYHPKTGEPTVITLHDAAEDDAPFLAARCSLGYLGIILSVTVECTPRYRVEETLRMFDSLEREVLADAEYHPLQQFALVPYSWRYYTFQRRVVPGRQLSARQKIGRNLYRGYKYLVVDVLMHGLVKLLAVRDWRAASRVFFGRIFPMVALRGITIVDESESVLTLRHDLYRHVEMEVFVPKRHFESAMLLVRYVIDIFSGSDAGVEGLPEVVRAELGKVKGSLELLRARKGSYTYHYVINCRRVHAEDGLIATTSGDTEYYSISFFSYGDHGEPYMDLCRYLATCLVGLYQARLHWGKIFPLPYESGAKFMYPESQLEHFRQVCQHFDRRGIFRNQYATRLLGFKP